jgi:hypothetical protein
MMYFKFKLQLKFEKKNKNYSYNCKFPQKLTLKNTLTYN